QDAPAREIFAVDHREMFQRARLSDGLPRADLRRREINGALRPERARTCVPAPAAFGRAWAGEEPSTFYLTGFAAQPASRARGGTGRRAGLRIQWGNPSEFESLRAHGAVKPPQGVWPNGFGQALGGEPYGAPRTRLTNRCGSSSVVEHRLAKARVASSNLVFRSISHKQESAAVHLHLDALGPHASRTRNSHYCRRP